MESGIVYRLCVKTILKVVPIVPSIGKLCSEDGIENNETCSHTRVLMIVVFFDGMQQFYFE